MASRKGHKIWGNKKNILNPRNTTVSFFEFKEHIKHNKKELLLLKKKSVFIKISIALLTLPNSIPLQLIRILISRFEDIVFHNSIKYAGGLVLFSFWWLLLIKIGWAYKNLATGLFFVLASIIFLYSRQNTIVKI